MCLVVCRAWEGALFHSGLCGPISLWSTSWCPNVCVCPNREPRLSSGLSAVPSGCQPPPQPPSFRPTGLVINSLIIHHYSNHYLPSSGPQCPRNCIQSGNCAVPHPLQNQHTLNTHWLAPFASSQIYQAHLPHLFVATCRKIPPFSSHLGPLYPQAHIQIIHTLPYTYTSTPYIHTCTFIPSPWVPGNVLLRRDPKAGVEGG